MKLSKLHIIWNEVSTNFTIKINQTNHFKKKMSTTLKQLLK